MSPHLFLFLEGRIHMGKTIQFRIESSADLGAIDSLIKKMGQLQQAAAKMNTTASKSSSSSNAATGGASASQLNAAASAMSKLSQSAAQLQKNMQTATAANQSYIIGLTNVSKGMGDLSNAAAKSVTSINQMTTTTTKMASGLNAAGQATIKFGSSLSATNGFTTKFVSGIDKLSSGALKVVSAFTQPTQSLTSFTQKLTSITGPMNNVVQQMSNFASKLAGTMANGLNKGANVAQSFSRNTQAAFASLRSTMSTAGGWFTNFSASIKNSMDAANRAIKEFYSAGWSMLTSGYMVKNFGDKVMGGLTGNLGDYVKYETQLIRTAIAASGNYTNEFGKSQYVDANPRAIEEIIQNVQRGFGDRPPVYQFDATELAEGIYYYTAAIGVPTITDGPMRNIENISAQVSDLMAVAAITGTNLDTMTKGVLNVASAFGIDPRNMSNGPLISKIAAQVGYLSNISSMEVPDIFEAFKNMGPMANILSGNQPGKGLEETMGLLYFASEAGLRGSRIGTGISAALSAITDPTKPMIDAASKYLGIDATREAFTAYFRDENGALKGGIMGFMDLLFNSTMTGLSDSQELDMINEMFTNNAARALITTMKAYNDDPTAFPELMDVLTSGSAEEWLSKAILLTNDTIGGNIQNLANAWDRLQINVIRSVEDPLKTGLKFISDIIWNLSDIVSNNPWLGELASGIAAIVGVIAGAIGSMMMFGGTILLIMQALSRLSAVGAPLMAIMLGIGRSALTAIPMLGLLAVATGLLYGAWVTDFLGMRTAVDGLLNGTSAAGKGLNNVLNGMGRAFRAVAFAFGEFFTGIIFGQGPIGDLAQFLFSTFGPLLGNAFMGKLVQFRDYMTDVRKGIEDFAHGASNVSAPIKDAGLAIQGFMESVFLNTQRYETFSAANRLGDMLGIDNLGVKMEQAAAAVRGAIEGIIGALAGMAGQVSIIVGHIADNLREVFTLDNLMTGLSAFWSFLQGVGAGLAGVFIGFLQAVEMATAALTHLGDAGRWVANLVHDLTGLELSLNGIARAAGVAVGAFMGMRALSFLSPLVGIFTTLVPIIGNVGLKLVEVGIRAAATVVQFTLMGAALAVQAVQWVANTAGAISNAAANAAVAASATVAAGGVGLLAVASAAVTATLATAAIGAAAFAVAMGIVVLILGGIVAAMFVAVAATSGLGAAMSAAGSFVQGLIAGFAPLGAIIQVVAVTFMSLAQVITLVAGTGNVFYTMGVMVAGAITLMIAAALAATAAFTAMTISMLVPFAPVIVGIIGVVAAFGLIGVAILAATGNLDVFPNAIQGMMALAVAAVAKGADGIYNNLTAPFRKFVNDLKDLRGAPGFDQLFSLWSGGMDAQILDNLSAVYGKPSDSFYTDAAVWIGQNLPGALETSGQDSAEAWTSGWMQKITDNVKGTPIEPILNQFKTMDWSKAWGTPQLEDQFDLLDDYSGLLDDTFVKWKDQAEKYSEYQKLVNTFGEQGAGMIWRSQHPFDSMIPTDPGSFTDYYMNLANQAEEGGQTVAQAVEEANKAIFDAFSGLSASEMTAKLFDINSGTGGKGKSAGGILAEIGDQIIGNVENAPDWLDWTELMADAAGNFDLDTNLIGKNLHTALTPALQYTADQLGVDVGTLLQDVPTFWAPEELIPMATTEFLTAVDKIPQSVYSKLDTFGIAEGWTDVGTKWSDLVNFAAAKSMSGENWDFADFIAESYGVKVEEVEAAMAAQGIDPTVVTQDMFGDTALWAQSMGGQLTILTEDMYNTAQQIMTEAGDKNIKLTQAQLDQMDANTKLYLAHEGYTFTLVADDQSELSLATDAAEKTAAIGAHAEAIAAAWANAAQTEPGTVAGFSGQIGEVASQIEEGTGRIMVAVKDLDGTTINMPAVDYTRTIEDVNQGNAVITEFYKGLQDNILEGSEGTVEGMQQITQAWEWLNDATGVMMVTLQDADGTVVTIPAAEYDAYLQSLKEIEAATKAWMEKQPQYWDDYYNKWGIDSQGEGRGLPGEQHGPKGEGRGLPGQQGDTTTPEGPMAQKALSDSEQAEKIYSDSQPKIQAAIEKSITGSPIKINFQDAIQIESGSFDAFGLNFAQGITQAISERMTGVDGDTAGMFKPITDMMLANFTREIQAGDFSKGLGTAFNDVFSKAFRDMMSGSTAADAANAGGGPVSVGGGFDQVIKNFATNFTEQFTTQLSEQMGNEKTGLGEAFNKIFADLFNDLNTSTPYSGGELTNGMQVRTMVDGFVKSFTETFKTEMSTQLGEQLPQAFNESFSLAFDMLSGTGPVGAGAALGSQIGGGGGFSDSMTSFAEGIVTQLKTALTTAFTGENGIGAAFSQAFNEALSSSMTATPADMATTGVSAMQAGIATWAQSIATSMATSIKTALSTALGTTLGPAIQEAFSTGMSQAMTTLAGGGFVPSSSGDVEMGMTGTTGMFDSWAQGIATSMAESLRTSITAAMASVDIQGIISSAISGIGIGAGGAGAGAAGAAMGAAAAAMGLGASSGISISVTITTTLVDNASTAVSTLRSTLQEMSSGSYTVSVGLVDNASSGIGGIIGLAQFFADMAPSPTMSIVDDATDPLVAITNLATFYGNMSESATVSVVDNATSTLNGIISLLGSITDKSVTVSVNQVVNTSGGNARAKGGPVTKGETYLVGEEGPEYVTFSDNGYVLNASQSRSIAASMADTQTNNIEIASQPTIMANFRFRDTQQPSSQQQSQAIVVNINNPVITKEADVQAIIAQVNRSTGNRIELANRGMEVLNDR